MQRNQLRIIGGQHRSRKLSFPDVEGLRPTGDRIRETLFNWLAPAVDGAYCLDLFAGSGALAFEALSRGAKHAVLVEQSPEACDHLRKNLVLLNAQAQAEILCMDSPHALQTLVGPFDIVFLDPPFASRQMASICAMLEERGLLKPGSLVYLEEAKSSPTTTLPQRWELHRDKSSGQVRYRLYRRL
jgi:16S rRNA (guanine966-N2)-methyltransferase